ncbi:MAG: hypothetical protein R2752_11540 [Vicinamibacterales bacterium]
MRNLVAAVVLVSAVALPAGLSGQAPVRRLDLTFDANGHVTLAAQNVTVREILSEWERKGGSHMVNLEKLTGGPLAIPVQFENQPELEVLQSLLASAAGVIAGPKTVDAPGPSRLGTIVIVPTSSPATAAYIPPASSAVAPPPSTPGSPADELPPVRPVPNPQDPATTQPATTSPPTQPGVFRPVPIVPIIAAPPAGGRGGGGGGGGTTTGRGGGGGGGGLIP